MTGLRIARVRAIFELPIEYDPVARGVLHPLAYVEWFTPFNAVDPHTGMYIVSHSTRHNIIVMHLSSPSLILSVLYILFRTLVSI